MEIHNVSFIENIGLTLLAVISIIFITKKLLKDIRLSSTGDNVSELMHKELQRVHTQNTLLSTELGKLQQEVIKLNGHIVELCAENHALQTKVVALTNELNEFKQMALTRDVKVL